MANHDAASQTVLIEIDREIVRRLRPAAVARGTTVVEIAREVLEVVASDRLVDAVLDDGPATR
jgi:hypothetical protein